MNPLKLLSNALWVDPPFAVSVPCDSPLIKSVIGCGHLLVVIYCHTVCTTSGPARRESSRVQYGSGSGVFTLVSDNLKQ